MTQNNKSILEKANATVTSGDNEGFLAYCTEDVKWTFVGDQTLQGKEAIRQYMRATYLEPPKLKVSDLIAEGDYVTALGEIALKGEDGKLVNYKYCDIWRFQEDKLAELTAFVIEIES